MGNCLECCRALFETKTVEPEEETPKAPEKPVEKSTKPKSARKFGSNLFPRKTSSNEKTPLIDNVGTSKQHNEDTNTTDEHEQSKKRSSLKKFKDKLKSRKSEKDKNGASETSAHAKSEQSTSSRLESPTSAAEATRRAHEGTVERGEKLQNTEEATATLADTCRRLSMTAKLISDQKKKSSFRKWKSKSLSDDVPE